MVEAFTNSMLACSLSGWLFTACIVVALRWPRLLPSQRGGRLVEVLIGQKAGHGLRYVGSASPTASHLGRQLFQSLRMLRVHTFCPFTGSRSQELPPRSEAELW